MQSAWIVLGPCVPVVSCTMHLVPRLQRNDLSGKQQGASSLVLAAYQSSWPQRPPSV